MKIEKRKYPLDSLTPNVAALSGVAVDDIYRWMETILGEPADEIMRGDVDDRWHAMGLAIVRFAPWLAEHLPNLRSCKTREIASFPRKGRGLAYTWNPGHGPIGHDGHVPKTFAVAFEDGKVLDVDAERIWDAKEYEELLGKAGGRIVYVAVEPVMQ